MESQNFLREKYRLQNSEEVKSAAKRTEERTGKKLHANTSEGADARIQNYLERLSNIINPPNIEEYPNFDRKQRNLEMLKRDMHKQFVIKFEDIPEAYFDSIKRKHREEGYGDIEIPYEYRKELAQTIITDQERSLDNWVEYLTSDDAKYPDWLRYYAFRSMLRMGRYEKKKKSFTERTDGTVAPFPDLDRGALSFVLDAFESREKGKEIKFGYDISDYAKKQFLEFLEKKNFAQLYAVTIEEFKPIEDDLLKITEGEWRVYPRGSDPKQLVESIAPYGTGWCLRGEATAGRYLVRDNNELQVFYSLDKEGKATVPRVVTVVNENNQLREVRGVAVEENLDQYIGDVVREKLKEFPDGVVYEKKSRDMKELTALSKKKERGEDLAKEDLRFLYEIEAKIKGFGYQRDPRIEEIKSTRNFEKDIETLCGCEPEYIAKNFTDITENTEVFCNIKGNNITIFDYRLPENKAKLQSHIEFLKNKKESGSIAELDLNLEGGVANISIDRSKSMQELIDAGNYDYVDPMLIKAFPNIEAGPSNLEVAFVRFNKDINGEEVIAELDKLGLRPVTASKLCAIGATFPELQQKQTLISLGSKTSVGDGLMVLYLLEFDAERVADLIPWDGDWRSDSCFPAVRK